MTAVRQRKNPAPIPFVAPLEEAPVLSIVVPVHNEAAVLMELYQRVRFVLNNTVDSWELLLVDDGSRDESAQMIAELCERDERVRGISLTRNFGFQIAVTAGLDAARGHAVVLMDADLQDPPEVIPELVARWREGLDVVYGVRSERAGETWFKRASASGFYRLIGRMTSVDIPLDTGDFRLMDRRVVDAIRRMPEQHRFLRGMVSWVGFKQAGVAYKRQPRFAGQTNFTLRKMLRFSLDAITGFSYLPLQLAGYVGAGLMLVSGLAIAGAMLAQLAGAARPLSGQAPTLLAVLFLGGVQLACLGIVGEYLGRMYDQARQRPLYLVSQRWGFDEPPAL
jgi:polyisoprenyl-phosphate glycosyltransferase